MKYIVCLIFISSAVIANPVKKSDLKPGLDDPVIPGTQVPVEKLNTAPTSPPIEEEKENFRNTLKAREKQEEELEEETEIKAIRKKQKL